jgi:cysteine synthase A
MTRNGGSASLGAIQRSLLDAIGDTPMVELRHLCDESKGRLVAKLESMNPTGSKDDRVARQVLEDARAEGRLGRCQTVVAATDGVTGLSLAQACAVLRHPFIAVMSRGCAVSQIVAMGALGCEVVLVDQHPDSPPGHVTASDRELCFDEVRKLVAITGAYDPDLLHNPSAFRAHRLGTGDEIVRQAGGQFGAFVDFVATGALLSGCAAAFHEFDPTIRCYAVEPSTAAALSGGEVQEPDHGIDGGGLGLAKLPLLDTEGLSGIVQVTRQEAYAAMVDLARKEGIFTGLSTGANLAAARKLLDGACFGETIVFVVHDNGARQISTQVRALDMGSSRAA